MVALCGAFLVTSRLHGSCTRFAGFIGGALRRLWGLGQTGVSLPRLGTGAAARKAASLVAKRVVPAAGHISSPLVVRIDRDLKGDAHM